MEISRNGIILNVERYEECVAFYRDLFDLPLMFSRNEGEFRLSCLALGSSYLMIETGGTAIDEGKSILVCPTKIRFNVPDMAAALLRVREFGLTAEIIENDWGVTINIHDPDGNRVGIRDEVGFVRQLCGSDV
ncbi:MULTISPECIES: VOC family protein [Aeromonas]|jgi:lactoylglutathione lyase|uniref:glyoxalase/bleomycin resistance/dioxygenase family protein n=1 Tax=Aeromonas TaxID=642 RepID=UPI0005EFBCB2|nr:MULTISPECIES: glyoxalase/bleomycin resistance/dioxygenase family protein [Aeromonas]ATP90902.1 glyoxalase/bleomycin resistance/dioxygenase family protein [Aeromonas caviae]AUV12962.1 glyoxalase/bleomycin resistance/dioxygenase family protein [Aeromonas sp. ASNIH3]MDX7781919.1 glyoxalase/bleomycin resistance/dioxygenase family protein [Aeromonas caviae]MDX7873176.1 glyoxalase/bleomycin resistance/dioxygenase family protein [Aeromonas caviae]MDY7764568.1 glyoxalase/bleomycin resistance/dioxyg